MITPDLYAVIFDLDGVLLDSEPFHHRAVNTILTHLRRRTLTTYAYDRYLGLDDETMWARISDDLELTVSQQWCREWFDQLVYTAYAHDAVLAPGAAHLLEALRLCEVPLAVASSSRTNWVECGLQSLGIAHLFDAIVTGDTVERHKPDPAPYLAAARQLGVPANRCLAVEDSRVGCLAALRAGAMVAHIDPSATGDGDDGHAHFCVPDLGELEGHLRFARYRIAARHHARLDVSATATSFDPTDVRDAPVPRGSGHRRI